MIIKNDSSVIAGYLEDASGYTRGFADRLIIPESENELADYLRSASERKEYITLSGGRTGVAAGCIAHGGTIVSLERFASLGDIQVDSKHARLTVGAAVRLEQLQQAAHQTGWMYGADPTESTGTLGGNVSTNASGGRSFKYGPTRNQVLELRVVLAQGGIAHLIRGQCPARGDTLRLELLSGQILEFNRPLLPALRVYKNAAGYFSRPDMDMIDLFIGMDGTLGAITSVTVALLPAPSGVFTLAIFFASDADALRCSALIRDAVNQRLGIQGWIPSALEYMDSHSLDLLRPAFLNIPESSRAVLLVEQEYDVGQEEAALQAWADFCEELGIPETRIWFAAQAADRERLRAFRHALPEAVNQLVHHHGFPKVGTDMAVPPDAFGDMMGIYRQGLERLHVDYCIFGHIGECHLHANVLPKTQNEYDAAKTLYRFFAQEAVARGGTVSAEHGIGKLKHDFMRIMVGEKGLREMARVKRVLDPAGILNRGNIFPEDYLTPLG